MANKSGKTVKRSAGAPKIDLFKLLSVGGVIIGTIIGVLLIKNSRLIENQASVSDGLARVYLEPAAGNYLVGSTFTVKQTFDMTTTDVPISGIATRVVYPFTGTVPEIEVVGVDLDSDFMASGSWVCPTKGFQILGNQVAIDIACAETGTQGYIVTGKKTLATVRLKMRSRPFINPTVLRFDPALSVVTVKNLNTDTLLIPTSTSAIYAGYISTTPSPTMAPLPTGLTPTKATGCVLSVYPPEVTIRKDENVSFAVFNTGKPVERVVFSSQNLPALEMRPAVDTIKPYLTMAKAHKVSKVTDTVVKVGGYKGNTKFCETEAKVKILP